MSFSPLYAKLAFQGYRAQITYNSGSKSSYDYLTYDDLKQAYLIEPGGFPSPQEVGETYLDQRRSLHFMGRALGKAIKVEVLCLASQDVLYERHL